MACKLLFLTAVIVASLAVRIEFLLLFQFYRVIVIDAESWLWKACLVRPYKVDVLIAKCDVVRKSDGDCAI